MNLEGFSKVAAKQRQTATHNGNLATDAKNFRTAAAMALIAIAQAIVYVGDAIRESTASRRVGQ